MRRSHGSAAGTEPRFLRAVGRWVLFKNFLNIIYMIRSLRAEAQKEATIKEAEGQAEATLKIQQANADGLRMLKEAAPDNAVLQIKSLEAFAKAADGQATKIIIPSDIQGIAGLSKSIVEIAKENG